MLRIKDMMLQKIMFLFDKNSRSIIGITGYGV